MSAPRKTARVVELAMAAQELTTAELEQLEQELRVELRERDRARR